MNHYERHLKVIALMLFLLGACHAQANDHLIGKEIYQRCAACHLNTAQGVPGMFPPLTQRLGFLSNNQSGRDYLAMVVVAGLMGSIQVEQQRYQGFMPSMGAGMKDDEVAAVLNYLLEVFNAETLAKNWLPYSQKEIVEIKARYPNSNAQKVHVLRQTAFEASTLSLQE